MEQGTFLKYVYGLVLLLTYFSCHRNIFFQPHPYQILFRSIDRHKGLMIFQLSRGTKVCQLVHRPAIFPDLPHDVAWLYVAVHHSVFTQMVHPVHWRQQRKKWFRIEVRQNPKIARQTRTHTLQNYEELCFRQAKGIFWFLQQTEQASTGAILHHKHLLLTGQLIRDRHLET